MITNLHDRCAWCFIQAAWPRLVLLLTGSGPESAELKVQAEAAGPRELLLIWAGAGTFLVLSVVLAGALESWLTNRKRSRGATSGSNLRERLVKASEPSGSGELVGRLRDAAADPKITFPLPEETVADRRRQTFTGVIFITAPAAFGKFPRMDRIDN